MNEFDCTGLLRRWRAITHSLSVRSAGGFALPWRVRFDTDVAPKVGDRLDSAMPGGAIVHALALRYNSLYTDKRQRPVYTVVYSMSIRLES